MQTSRRTRRSRFLRASRWLAGASAVMAVAGLLGPATAQVATADQTGGTATDSAVTIAWDGEGNGDLQQYQPERDAENHHYGDFQDVEVTVSQTEDLTDQLVEVTVTGMPGATQRGNMPGTAPVEFGSNFVQAMQCWGDPADPDFYQNCQFGAYPYSGDNPAAPNVYNGFMAQLSGPINRGTYQHDVPFRAVTGDVYSSLPLNQTNSAPLLEIFRAQNTNEATALVDSTGTARFSMEMQSAASQPYLGCGNLESATGERCWLVLVPRGEQVSPPQEYCMTDPAQAPVQQGSAISPACDYWQNRVVVPMDFQPVGAACVAGSAERRTVGSDTAAAAMGSWQTALCQDGGTVFSYTSAADPVARQQVVTGQVGLAYTNQPVTAETLPAGTDPLALEQAELVYAPVANSATSLSFRSNNRGSVTEDLKLTPRLLAKLVTYSYRDDFGMYTSQGFEDIESPWDAAPRGLIFDPEFRELNPGVSLTPAFTLALPGPNPTDAVAQFWAYIQSDEKAAAFLAGEPDNVLPGDEENLGMSINPNYLPKGHPDARVPAATEEDRRASTGSEVSTMVPKLDGNGDPVWNEVGLTYTDGTPLCLCNAPENTFRMADQTLLPQMLVGGGQDVRYDQTQRFPFAANALGAAQMLARGDTGAETLWSSVVNVSPGVYGGYVSTGGRSASRIFMAAVTDSVNAERFMFNSFSLQAPNEPETFHTPESAAMASALEARQSTAVDGVETIDPADVPASAYPLTSTTYAAVNLTASDEQAREDYANLIEYAATDGQVQGTDTGELPLGYLPLTEDQRKQALATADEIRAYDPPEGEEPAADGEGEDPAAAGGGSAGGGTGTGPAGGGAAPVSGGGNNPNDGGEAGLSAGESPGTDPSGEDAPGSDSQTEFSAGPAAELDATSATGVPGQAILGGVLLLGTLGLVGAPFLLRRSRVES